MDSPTLHTQSKSVPVHEDPMPKAKPATRRRRVTRPQPQFVMRVNVLLTQEQYVQLQKWARDEGRPLPNLIRRLIDLGITQRT